MQKAAPTTSPSAFRQFARNVLELAAPRDLFLTRGATSSRTVCLTFDDGPDPEHTPALLDLLGREEIRATFFVVGKSAWRYPNLVRRILAEGHALGNHSYWHGEPERTGTLRLANEIRQTERVLQRVARRTSNLFRPPEGKVGAAKLALLWGMRKTVVLWNRDPRDWAAQSADEVSRYFEERPLQGGDVVLLHDVCPWASAVVPLLAQQARASGLRFDTVEALLQEHAPSPREA